MNVAVPMKEPLLKSKENITFSLNGRDVEALPGETIIQAADRLGIEIPRLCYTDRYESAGNCRACVVEIEGERVLQPSCCRKPVSGMQVTSNSERVVQSQSMVLELLKGEVGEALHTKESELEHWCNKLEVTESRFGGRKQPSQDISHPAIAVNMESCIQCTRCVRACREEQMNDVIGLAFRGSHAQIVFDVGDQMGNSSCVGCGECVQACPTGALMPSGEVGLEDIDKKVDSVCPYCGVGCLLTYHIKQNKIRYVTGRDGPANKSRLCVKGRYGFDYVNNPERLMYPMIRKKGIPKGFNEYFDPSDPTKMFEQVSWDEALDFAANGLKNIRDNFGSNALAGFGSAKGSNEEAYLFQKLIRTGFGTNNVDHCTRLCHASSVVALLEGIGSGAVSNQVEDALQSEVIVVIGANPTGNHPVAATFIKNAARKGATLIVMDPRRTEIARHAQHFLQFRPDSDVALLNAMIHTIIEEDLTDSDFIKSRTRNFKDLKESVKDFSPEEMSNICGIDAEKIRECARIYAKSRASIIFWGMGVSQHVHGTDNARCLIALALMTGNIGRPGVGLHPLRGQNNVQGASDAGLIPMMFPDYRRVDNEEASIFFSNYWNATLDKTPGLTVVEIMDKACEGEIRGMYIMGENPAMSDPDLNHARQGLSGLDHLVVQDIFLTETAAYADVVLPASAFPEKTGTFSNTDRRVQMGRQALELPGNVRQDLWIIRDLAVRLGLDWEYESVESVFNEMRGAMPSISGMSWERLNNEHSITYPCMTEHDQGEGIVFKEDFPTEDGLGRFVPAKLSEADETPDTEFPYVLITGRQLEHWHTGSMTRRATILDAIEPEPVVSVNPIDLRKFGIGEGEAIRVVSRRGELEAIARSDRGLREGEVYIPFCYHEAAANLLTNAALDPYGKIAEVKYCAVRVSAA